MYRSQTPLPYQVFAYYVLFSLLGLVVIGAGLVYLSRSQESVTDSKKLEKLVDRASSTLSIAYSIDGDSGVRDAVIRIGSFEDVVYCAFVGVDGVCVGHTTPSLIGDVYQTTPGEVRFLESYNETTFAPGSGVAREVAATCKKNGQPLGTLRLGLSAKEDGVYAKAILTCLGVLLTPILILLLIGGFVIRSLVLPMANIHKQLSKLASHQMVGDVEFEPIPKSDAMSIGWNKLVEELSTNYKPVEERVAEKVSASSASQEVEFFNSLTDGVAQTDAEGKITFINNAMKALIGLDDQTEEFSEPLQQYLQEEAADSDNQESIDHLFDSNGSLKSAVAEITKTFDGSQRVLRVSRQPIRSREHNSRATDRKPRQAWSVRDITQQKLADKARTEFLDSASHEIRTPLSNIKAYAETLQLTDMIDVEQQKEFCNVINSEATRLARFIDDLLDVSSIEAGSIGVTLQKVELRRLLDEAIGKVRPLMEQKNINFETSFAEKLPELPLDKDKFVTCLVNLLGNAAKYTPEGGNVSFRARVANKELVIEIADTGFGISESELPHVFEKFYRSDDERVQDEVGTGLGLAFTQEIIQLHRGTLTADSVLNEGSTFTITVPVS